MRESIKDKVAIIGTGCTKFAERWDADVEDLIKEAVDEALEDAGVEIKDIQFHLLYVNSGRDLLPDQFAILTCLHLIKCL